MNSLSFDSTDNAYVLSLDILGFGKIVKNNRHRYLVDLFEKYINTYNADIQLVNEYYLKKVADLTTEELKALFISDTLIIYSLNAEIENFLKLVSLTQVILTNSFELGIPLRGCLTSGPLTIKHFINNDILFGKSIVDAYEYEKVQEWAGCCITNHCVETVEKFHVNKNKPGMKWLLDNKDVVLYDVPIKENRFEQMMVVNWIITANHVNLSKESIITAFNSHNKGPKNFDDYLKIERLRNNTINFWKTNNKMT